MNEVSINLVGNSNETDIKLSVKTSEKNVLVVEGDAFSVNASANEDVQVKSVEAVVEELDKLINDDCDDVKAKDNIGDETTSTKIENGINALLEDAAGKNETEINHNTEQSAQQDKTANEVTDVQSQDPNNECIEKKKNDAFTEEGNVVVSSSEETSAISPSIIETSELVEKIVVQEKVTEMPPTDEGLEPSKQELTTASGTSDAVADNQCASVVSPCISNDKIKSMDVDCKESIVDNKESTEKVSNKMSPPSSANTNENALMNAEKCDTKMESESPNVQPINGDIGKDEKAKKRRISEDSDADTPFKKLFREVEKTLPQHDTMINDYIQTATKNNVDEIQRHTEQLLSEVQTLRELAQKKEQEWNNILHLKKVKEEILLRLLRRKQVLSFEKSADGNGSDKLDSFDFMNQIKNFAIDKSDEISGLAIKQPGSSVSPMLQNPVLPGSPHFNPMAGLPPPYDKAPHMQSMPKPVFPQPLMMPGPTMTGFPRDMNGQLPTSYGMPMGRQGPTKDVKSIIADYRQRNPDLVPRRGRRMKSILNPNIMNSPRPILPKMDAMNNLSNFNIFNSLDINHKAMLDRLQQLQAGNLAAHNGMSFKDVLVQFANMQQTNPSLMSNRPMDLMPSKPDHTPTQSKAENRRRQERPQEEAPSRGQERRATPSPRLPPPPYPEISLLPVTTSTETTPAPPHNSLLHGILTKNCGEITITPVQPTPPPDPQPEKAEEVVQLDDEESVVSEGSAATSPSGSGRLVIDEGGAGAAGAPGTTGSEAAEDAPLCQGCRRRDAQFVCAGCANQWYCSRECQVAAWDDHSEMCSG